MTKIFPALAIMLLLAGCKDLQRPGESQTGIPAVQTKLQKLAADYRKEYLAAGNIDKDTIIGKYYNRLHDVLQLENLDSFRVYLDYKIIKERTIETSFSCGRDIEFKYSITFVDSLNPRQDSLYNAIKGMSTDTELLVNFTYMGSYSIEDPTKPGMPVFRIFAIPSPVPLHWHQ